MLQGLLGRGLRGRGGQGIGGLAGRTSAWSAATGLPVYGQARTLVMHEISAGHGEQMTAGEALSADVACLVYDLTDPESFRYVANIFLVRLPPPADPHHPFLTDLCLGESWAEVVVV